DPARIPTTASVCRSFSPTGIRVVRRSRISAMPRACRWPNSSRGGGGWNLGGDAEVRAASARFQVLPPIQALARFQGFAVEAGVGGEDRNLGVEEDPLCLRAEDELPDRRAYAQADDDELGFVLRGEVVERAGQIVFMVGLEQLDVDVRFLAEVDDPLDLVLTDLGRSSTGTSSL